MKFQNEDIVTVVKKYPSNDIWTWVEGDMDKHIGQQGKIICCASFNEYGRRIPSYQIIFPGAQHLFFFREECIELSDSILTLITY